MPATDQAEGTPETKAARAGEPVVRVVMDFNGRRFAPDHGMVAINGSPCPRRAQKWHSVALDQPTRPTTMQEFQIPNMSCGHCVRAITEAVQALDPAAKVQTDVAKRQVQVDSKVPREALVQQLNNAGYTPA